MQFYNNVAYKELEEENSKSDNKKITPNCNHVDVPVRNNYIAARAQIITQITVLILVISCVGLLAVLLAKTNKLGDLDTPSASNTNDQTQLHLKDGTIPQTSHPQAKSIIDHQTSHNEQTEATSIKTNVLTARHWNTDISRIPVTPASSTKRSTFASGKVQVRLVNGLSANVGRLEVFHNNEWGTVCDDSFDVADARVVCRMLGFATKGSRVLDTAYFGQGLGPILLDDVACLGSELNIFDCPSRGLYLHNCGHSEDVGIACDNGNQTIVRLVNGPSANIGRLEVFYNNSWGTVCDDTFDVADARVVCRMLGFATIRSTVIDATYFGPGSGPIHLREVECHGSELDIFDCPSSSRYQRNCYHFEDVGVFCDNETVEPEVLVRLVRGNSSGGDRGRLEVFYKGLWGTVCNNNFDNRDARVVCRMLGFQSNYGKSVPNAFWVSSVPILLDNLNCDGTEANIGLCRGSSWFNNTCYHYMDVGVICYTDKVQIRLVNGSSSSSGRVEVFYNNTWGTVCDNSFGMANAQVVCTMLGFTTRRGIAIKGAYFGRGSGPILLDNVKCNKSQSNIGLCESRGWYAHNCTHNQDVGVFCDDDTIEADDVKVRLINNNKNITTSPASRGRLEVFYKGIWGTVCDDNFDYRAAQVVCRMLGFETNYSKADTFVSSGRPVLLDNLNCAGSEANISLCESSGWLNSTCFYGNDVGITCFADKLEVRLKNGPSSHSGRLEVFYNNSWGTVCDDSFGMTESQVVCRMLGLSTNRSVPIGGAYFGRGLGPIHFNYLQCVGSELNIGQCKSKGEYQYFYCGHSDDVGIFCDDGTEYTDVKVRLFNYGNFTDRGRLEVYYKGIWGTVCSNEFDDRDARVVCRMLGLESNYSKAIQNSFGAGSGAILLDHLNCTGSERNITSCGSSSWFNTSCNHYNDVGVICYSEHDGNVQVRLVGGRSAGSGRLEVFYNNTWGTVCDDGFDERDAQVACRMLGFPTNTSYPAPVGMFGQGSGPIMLNDVNCNGSETNIAFCNKIGWYNSRCGHWEDVGIFCQSDCPANWTAFRSSCYHYTGGATTYTYAERYCKEMTIPSHLVHINDAAENDFIKRMLTGYTYKDYWMALKQVSSNRDIDYLWSYSSYISYRPYRTNRPYLRQWKWTDNNESIGFEDWAWGYLDNDRFELMCATFSASNTRAWTSASCVSYNYPLCEHEKIRT